MITQIPKIQYVAWTSIPSAIPSVVVSHALFHHAIAFFITTTKSGPGLITARRIIDPIIRSVDIMVIDSSKMYTILNNMKDPENFYNNILSIMLWILRYRSE
jgi:hypothetical protein